MQPNHLIKSYLELIRDSLSYLKPGSTFAIEEPKQEKKENDAPQLKQPIVQKSTKFADAPHPVGSFSLESPPSMPTHLQSFDIQTLVLKHAPEIVHKKKNFVFLYFDSAHQQFLDNVAKATAKTLMPARALPYESDQIFTDSEITIIAAAWNHLPIPKSLHKLIIRKQAPHFFPLATIEEYRQDQSLKLALWKALKNLQIHSLP